MNMNHKYGVYKDNNKNPGFIKIISRGYFLCCFFTVCILCCVIANRVYCFLGIISMQNKNLAIHGRKKIATDHDIYLNITL